MQYSVGTVSVTNGSSIVTGSDTLWLSNIDIDFSFKLIRDNDFYDILSVDSNTQLTLERSYTGDTGTELQYVILRDFTHHFKFPTINRGSVNWPEIVSKSLKLIDDNLYETQENKEVKSITFEPLIDAPTEDEGVIYFDNTTKRFKYWNGTEWKTIVTS